MALNQRRLSVLALTALAPALLGACGSSASSDGSATNSPDPTGQVSTAAPASSSAEPTTASSATTEATKQASSAEPEATETTPTTVATSAAADQNTQLQQAAAGFNDALLSDKPAEARNFLSKACQQRVSAEAMKGIAKARKAEFGGPQKMTSFKAQISGRTALLTYTYAKSKLNRQMEPWVLEGTAWKMDDCQG